MARKLNFTKTTLFAFPPPFNGARIYYITTKKPGVMFVITRLGTRSFIFYRKIEGRPERILIGRFDDLTIEQARNKAAELNAAIAQGHNPADKRRLAREEMTLQELFDDYMARHTKPNKRF